jgi:hypothetical protein
MMIKRILGILLALAGALGILLCVLGVLYVWRAADRVAAAADDAAGLLADTLDNVERSLDVASTTLDDAVAAVEALHATTLGVGETLSSTHPTLDGMADLAKDDLAGSIASTREALEVMAETAGVIDRTMRGLSQLGVGDYDPDVPLDQAIAAAGEDLEPVPDGLRQMGDGLRQTGTSLQSVQGGITQMGDHILEIGKDVGSANAILGSQTDVVQRLQERLHALRQNVDQPIRVIAWGVTLLLIWIGLSQLALIQWGISLWR